MRYIKNYYGFLIESENTGQKIEVTPQTIKNLDKTIQQAGIDLEDEETLAALMNDVSNQLEKNLNNPKPKISIDLSPQSIKEKIEYNRKYRKINESGGHGAGGHGMLESAIHILEYFFTTGEIAETSAHNVLGHLGHDHGHGHEEEDHGLTEKDINDAKNYLKKNQSGITGVLKSFLKTIKGLSSLLYNATLGVLEKLIIWVCRNIFKTKVSTASKAAGYVLAATAIGLFAFTAAQAISVGGIFTVGSLFQILTGFATWLSHSGSTVAHLMHAGFGIFRTLKTTSTLGKGKHITSLIEFGDVVEDALKSAAGDKDSWLRQDIYQKTERGTKTIGKLFIRSNHILLLKDTQSHLNKQTIKFLSEYLGDIFEKKDSKKLREVPYFCQCLKEFEGQDVTSDDLRKSGHWYSKKPSKFEQWLEKKVGEDIFNKEEEYYQEHIEPVMKDLEERGIKPTYLTKSGDIDTKKYQEEADYWYNVMKGLGHKLQDDSRFRGLETLKKHFKNEADWKLTFFTFDIKNNRNLISWFYSEFPEKSKYGVEKDLKISVEMIKRALKDAGCKNVDEDFEYFSSKEGRDKLIRGVK